MDGMFCSPVSIRVSLNTNSSFSLSFSFQNSLDPLSIPTYCLSFTLTLWFQPNTIPPCSRMDPRFTCYCSLLSLSIQTHTLEKRVRNFNRVNFTQSTHFSICFLLSFSLHLNIEQEERDLKWNVCVTIRFGNRTYFLFSLFSIVRFCEER